MLRQVIAAGWIRTIIHFETRCSFINLFSSKLPPCVQMNGLTWDHIHQLHSLGFLRSIYYYYKHSLAATMSFRKNEFKFPWLIQEPGHFHRWIWTLSHAVPMPVKETCQVRKICSKVDIAIYHLYDEPVKSSDVSRCQFQINQIPDNTWQDPMRSQQGGSFLAFPAFSIDA